MRRTLLMLSAFALVLSACVGGAEHGGRTPMGTNAAGGEPQVAACPEGSRPDEPGPVDQARPTFLWSPSMAFDRDSGRIVLVQPAGRVRHHPATWTFDVCSNTWHRMSPEQTPRVGWHLVHDADSDLTVALSGRGRVWAYDLESDTWTKKARTWPFGPSAMAYDPQSGLAVLLEANSPILHGRAWLWTYDVDPDVWLRVHQDYRAKLQPGSQLVYDASVGRFVGYGEPWTETGTTRTLDLTTWWPEFSTARWSPILATPPPMGGGWGSSGGEAAYDEAAGMTVVFNLGFVAAYDASADRWMSLYGHPAGEGTVPLGPLTRQGHEMVYDPVNERLVVLGGYVARADGSARWMDDVWAFDTATHEWTRLLAPSEPQA